MDIRQLETFLRVIDAGSFAAAAEALSATPSAVSARIRELERSLGVDLFDRSQHRAQLTAKGQELVASAREIVALATRVRHQIGDVEALTGTVRLGVVGLVAITWLPKLMVAMRTNYPGVTVTLEAALSAALLERLRGGHLDLAIVTGPVAEASLEAISLGFDKFVWMAPPSMPIPARRLTPRELARWPVLGLSTLSHHYPVLEQWFRKGDAEYRPVISCSNVHILADLTLAGLGVSLLPQSTYAADVATGRLRLLDTEPEIGPVEFVALHRRSATDPLVSAVARLAMEVSEFGAL